MLFRAFCHCFFDCLLAVQIGQAEQSEPVPQQDEPFLRRLIASLIPKTTAAAISMMSMISAVFIQPTPISIAMARTISVTA